MQGIERAVTEHALTAVVVAWLLVNVLVGVVAHLIYRQEVRRERALHEAAEQRQREQFEHRAADLEHQRAEAWEEHAAVHAQLRGYRDAVRQLTQHPTTVIVGAQADAQPLTVDPWRAAARNGQEAPTQPIDRGAVDAIIEEGRARLADEVESIIAASRNGHLA